ncbi:predicted protein [Nematostella vectensis]|uniref:Calponin-homology (CH) domain-containing protein n=1 Tax=Nematostella vectensis TaxID=45351 RepID=A7RHN8_NEMVE|nr:filamin-C [Nematostella vectensis]EDO49009.1 predicted protein [Nematostella vectensis]|eukprot:XP_001641072.1 predicted protein [Nematostella vectensis]
MASVICHVSGYSRLVRRRAFTKWLNLYLNERLSALNDVIELADCAVAAIFLEVATGRELVLHRSCRKASRKRQEGWRKIACFLETEHFSFTLSNQDIDKIAKGSVDAILTLVWNLIEHFLITPSREMLGKTQSSAKCFLLDWVRRKLPHRDINNFDTDWRDGMAICELVNALQPGLIPDSKYKEKTNSEATAKIGIQTAHDAFGIPLIISPFDLTASEHADELGMLTYIALFCKYENLMKNDRNNNTKSKLSTPLRSREEIVCKAYGTGLKEGELGKVAEFTVELNGARPTDVTIAIECKPLRGGFEEKPELSVKPLGKSTYAVKYLPSNPGEYVISVLHCGAHILRSPFYLTVTEPNLDLSRTNSDLLLHGSLNSLMASRESLVKSSPPGNSSSPGIPPSGPANSFPPVTPTSLTANSSPSGIPPSPPDNAFMSKIPVNTAEGPGLVAGEVGQVGSFTVLTDNNTKGPLSVCISCPAVSIPVPYVKSDKRDSYTEHKVVYIPTEPGTYEIFIKWGEHGIRGSPFKVFINDVNQNDMDTAIGSDQDLCDKGKIQVFYSATATNAKVRRDREMLDRFLRDKGVTARRDYQPWVTLDVGMSRKKREDIFKRAGTRKTPMLFINGEYIGGYEDLVIMDKQGLFDRCLNYE